MVTDRYGYIVKGGHPVTNEYNNAIVACSIGGANESVEERIKVAEKKVLE